MAFGDGGREYVLKIVADVKDAVKGVDDVSTKTQGMKDTMLGIGKSVAAGLATGAVIAFGKSTVTAAAEADDAADAITAAFGDSAAGIAKFSEDSAKNLGMSEQDFQQMAALTGSALQSMGISAEDAAKQTEAMSTRAADMAAIYGGTTEEAMQAITKAMAGSTKGLQKYGVVIKASEIEARAMASGYVDASGKVTEAGKAIAAQELIIENTAQVQGAWAANSKDLGSQQATMAAQVENLQAEIGSKLLPVIVQLLQYLTPLIQVIADNVGWLLPLAGIVVGIVAAIKLWTIAQTAFNVVMMANPILLIAAAIAALVAGIIIAYQKVDWFRAAVDAMGHAVVAVFNWIVDAAKAVFNWIKDNWPLLLGILTGPFGLAISLIIQNWDTVKGAVKGVIESIKGFVSGIPNAIKSALTTLVNIITEPFKKAWDIIKEIPGDIVDKFKGIVTSIKNLLTGIADAISAPFKTAFTAIKNLWNSTVGGFGFSVPGWVPGIGGKKFSIPEMQLGGIVTKPTVALLGEAGPEAVVPLGKSLPVGNVIINVYALTANAEVGRKVYEALNEYQRTSGKTLVGP